MNNPAKTNNIAPIRADIAYVIEPRFPGGTSSAVAQELRVVSEFANPVVYGIRSKMFSGDEIAPQLELALAELGLEIIWDPARISADIVILHNPAFLKFQTKLASRIVAKRLYVVTHENFLRPNGAPSFDVANCLTQIDRAALALEKFIAPISPHNRATAQTWLATSGKFENWSMLRDNWFNICNFDLQEPTTSPQDRRGRLSRPGHEKFPDLASLELCFPASARSNVLLGADTLMAHKAEHPHWELLPFRAIEPDQFYDRIDFMVYFTSSVLRESFGRVLAEAIAAGKVVLSDVATAASFGGGVIATTPEQVSNVIAEFVANPKTYGQQVRRAQKLLDGFSAPTFRNFFCQQVLEYQGQKS